MTELVQIEVAFMAFMHRILQPRSIFEQLYIARKIDLGSLSKFDTLLSEGMTRTVELLEQTTGHENAKSDKDKESAK